MNPAMPSTSTNTQSTRQLRLFFYAIWFLVTLVQAAGTELFDDEAYYWVYSRFLDWGYFDHPPMIAVLIKLGTAILPGELGLRFFIVLMGTATIALIEYLTQPKDIKLFFAIVLNMAVLQIGGIIAAPDIPLLFLLHCSSFVTNALMKRMILSVPSPLHLLLPCYSTASIMVF